MPPKPTTWRSRWPSDLVERMDAIGVDATFLRDQFGGTPGTDVLSERGPTRRCRRFLECLLGTDDETLAQRFGWPPLDRAPDPVLAHEWPPEEPFAGWNSGRGERWNLGDVLRSKGWPTGLADSIPLEVARAAVASDHCFQRDVAGVLRSAGLTPTSIFRIPKKRDDRLEIPRRTVEGLTGSFAMSVDELVAVMRWRVTNRFAAVLDRSARHPGCFHLGRGRKVVPPRG